MALLIALLVFLNRNLTLRGVYVIASPVPYQPSFYQLIETDIYGQNHHFVPTGPDQLLEQGRSETIYELPIALASLLPLVVPSFVGGLTNLGGKLMTYREWS